MAYVIPERWTQGEIPTAAKLTTFKDALDDVYAQTGSKLYNVATLVNLTTARSRGYFFVHQQRYLHYLESIELVDPTGANASVTVAGSSSWAVYDLQSVGWIYLGKLYEVKDGLAAFEDEEN
jgi:hypothetical protein